MAEFCYPQKTFLRFPVIDKFDRAIHRPLFSENHEEVSANQLLASINVVLCILHACYRYFQGAGTLSPTISIFSDQFLTHISCLDLRCCWSIFKFKTTLRELQSTGMTLISCNDRYLYVGSLQISILESSGRYIMLGHSEGSGRRQTQILVTRLFI